jgi:tetratricopeptide (TPR) repeat protein
MPIMSFRVISWIAFGCGRRRRRVSALIVGLLALALPSIVSLSFSPLASAQTQTDELPGLAELKQGEYDKAVQLLTARLATTPADVDSQKYLLRAYVETGRYTEAESSAKKFLSKVSSAGPVRHELAEVFALTGRHTEAVAEFERSSGETQKSNGSPAEWLASDLRRAEVLELVGQGDLARPIFESILNYYNENEPSTAPELTVVARALVHLERFQDANDLFRNAIEADSSYFEAHLYAAELFTQKYNYAEASQFLDDALKINPNSARGHLDVAINKSLEGGEEMLTAISRALAINPNYVIARAFKAGLALQAEEYVEATLEIEKVLKVNPRSLEAHAFRAVMAYLQDRDISPDVAATLAINPRYGTLFNFLSRYATMIRRNEQAAQFARRAIELSPQLWGAHLNLGMALLRLGQMEAGRAAVEKSFKGDPFNLWAKNTLDLLDAMADYRETKRGPFLIKAAASESNVVSGYAAILLEEAAAKLTAKYRFTPPGPITVELFPNHEDFAVRALGLPGLGALGVCFGPVIAQDSPSARQAGEFNWGSTLWHEYTHVITLQMTDYRIPRWFTEGLAGYEERRARPGWGDDWNPVFLRALAEGRWFKIEDLDAGFQRPLNAEDVSIAYFQASQVCEFIADRYGFDTILRMLALYRDKARTPEVLRQALKLSEGEFDRAFMNYVEAKARPLQQALKTEANLAAALTKQDVLKLLATEDTFAIHLRAGNLYLADGETEAAVRHFRRAIELFPYHTEEGSAYALLAEIFEKKGDNAQAADILELLVKVDGNNLNALKTLVRLRFAQGDQRRALEALRLSFYVDPFNYALHTLAGELNMEAKDYAGALLEFQTTLALEPPNVAEANYNVANAYHALGKQTEAKRSVLRALEAAPRYEKAQELLLRITGQ